jgi:hypothetical protein
VFSQKRATDFQTAVTHSRGCCGYNGLRGGKQENRPDLMKHRTCAQTPVEDEREIEETTRGKGDGDRGYRNLL